MHALIHAYIHSHTYRYTQRGAGEPSLRHISPEGLTSSSFARARRLLNETYNVMGALRYCRAVKFDACDHL